MAPSGASAQTVLPDINVIAPSPLPPRRAAPRPTAAPQSQTNAAPPQAAPAQPPTGGIDRDKVPANTQVVTSADFDHARSPALFDSLLQSLPGVSVSDQTANPFQRDLQYRGFTASPVLGTPQGIAVYQNGVRVNEVFGDTVNWDFIPDVAVHRLTLVPNSPIFGLNAIGGAISVEMKNGFTYQGKEAEVMGGSYGRVQGAAQAGFRDGNFAGYVMADAIKDDGWRQFNASSRLKRMYVDLGARNDQSEFHLSFTGADNMLAGTVGTPLEMLQRNWSSVFTSPQTTHNQLAFLTTTGSYSPTDTLTIAGNAYFRGYWQHHVDGNNTSAQFCDQTQVANLLCFGDKVTPLDGAGNLVIPTTATLGEIDRSQTNAASFGGSVQATSTMKVLDHPNNFVVGVSVDRGHVQYNADSELGTIDNNLFVTGTGFIINQPEGDVAPVSLLAATTYTGLYATDTFEITPRLALTAGGRFNVAQITLDDQTGGPLSSDNQFQRFNPVVGATYKLLPSTTVYAGYSEANRAPTPIELGCSNPSRPCLIDNFVTSDPPLKQVVSHTVEAGLRGNFALGNLALGLPNGQLGWNVGVFRTENTDDIINVSNTTVLGTGFFLNAAKTLRQGVEAGITLKSNPWNVYANYTFVDATFQTTMNLPVGNNPAPNGVDSQGNPLIVVTPGDHIPNVPQHRFKAGIEYAVTDAWKIGIDVNAVGSQFATGDQANQNPKVPPYAVVNLHGSYQVTKNIELFALVQNLFNQHYYTTGTFFDPGSVPASLGLSDHRMYVPGTPLAAYAGVRARF